MSEKQSTFSHITVHAQDDDDFVIQAGAKPSTPPRVAVSQDETTQEIEAEEPPVQTPAKVSSSASEKSVDKPVKDDGYHETTLEDLQSTPMSSMQKIIIALALIGVACAIIYCVFFTN